MKRNTAYMRCCSNLQAKSTPALFSVAQPTTNLQALEWADAFKTGKVTISDIALAASVFGQSNSTSATAAYFANSLYSSAPLSGTVTIGDIAVAASYFDHGITAPFLGTGAFLTGGPPAGLTQYTPNVDPYLLTRNPVYLMGVKINDISFAIGAGESGTINVSATPLAPCTGPPSNIPLNTPYNGGANGNSIAPKWTPHLIQGCMYFIAYTISPSGGGLPVQGNLKYTA